MRLFLAVLLLFGFATPAIAGKCSLKQAASLDMVSGFPGRVVVELSIGGKPSRFLIDTGGYSSIFQDVADSLGLDTHPVDQSMEIYDVSGAKLRRFTKIPNLMIGAMKGDSVPVLVIPREHGTDPGVDGIIGADLLSQFDADFDFANHKLNLILQDHCEGIVVYWSPNYADADFHLVGLHMVLGMNLDGHDVSAILDTGSPRTHLYDNVARSKFDLDTNSAGMELIPDNAPDAQTQYRYRFKSLSIGGLAINNPLIYILPNLALKSFSRNHTAKEDFDPIYAPKLEGADMLLGMDVISKLHLYIAYKEHKIYLTAADAH